MIDVAWHRHQVLCLAVRTSHNLPTIRVVGMHLLHAVSASKVHRHDSRKILIGLFTGTAVVPPSNHSRCVTVEVRMDPREPISGLPEFSAADLRALARQARRRARLLEIAAAAQEAAERRHPFAERSDEAPRIENPQTERPEEI